MYIKSNEDISDKNLWDSARAALEEIVQLSQFILEKKVEKQICKFSP